MISKSRKLDLVYITILASLLLVGVGYQLGHSFTGTTNTFAVGSLETADVNFTGDWFRGITNVTDVVANPEQGASYIIYRSVNTYFSKNGTTGQIDYSGGNVSDVTQNSIDDLSSTGGMIFFKSGTYDFSNTVNWPIDSSEYTNPIIIIGAGWNTVFTRSASIPFFTMDGGANRCRNIIFRDLQFKPGATTGEVLHFNHSDRIRIEDVLFYATVNSSYAIYAEDSWDAIVYGSLFHGGGNNTQAIVYLFNGRSGDNSNNWRFIASRFERGSTFNSIAIHSDGTGTGTDNHNIHIINNKIHGGPSDEFTGSAILFESTKRSSIKDNWIAHHLGNVVNVDENCSIIDIQGNIFLTFAFQGNPTSFVRVNGDDCKVQNTLTEGTPTQIVLVDTNGNDNWITEIISRTGGVTSITDSGTDTILTPVLNDNWNVGDFNVTASNFTANDYWLTSVGNFTAWIESVVGWDGTGALFQNGTRELTDNWDAGDFNITASNFTASDYWLNSVGNFTAWVESQVVSGDAVTLAGTVVIGADASNINVTNYVLVDGTADDVQINAAFSGGAFRVQLQADTVYDIDSTIVMNEEYQELIGMGKSTILRADNNLEANVINMTGTAEWFQSVRDLQIEGNKANNANGHSIYMEHVYGTTDSHILLERLWIRNSAQDGVHIASGTGTREVHLSLLVVSFADGISYRIGGTDIKADHLISENPQSHGFMIFSNGQYDLCKSFGAGKGGSGNAWYLSGQKNGIQINNGVGEDADGKGLLIWNCNNTLITNFLANSNEDEGIMVDGDNPDDTGYNIITGYSSFSRSGGLFTQSYGVRLTSDASNTIVSDGVGFGDVAGISDAGTTNFVNSSFNNTVYVP